jgi:hypothetical protein
MAASGGERGARRCSLSPDQARGRLPIQSLGAGKAALSNAHCDSADHPIAVAFPIESASAIWVEMKPDAVAPYPGRMVRAQTVRNSIAESSLPHQPPMPIFAIGAKEPCPARLHLIDGLVLPCPTSTDKLGHGLDDGVGLFQH